MSGMADDALATATAAVEQHLMLYMLPANYALNREYNQQVTDANAGTIAAKVIAALSAAGFGPVEEAAAKALEDAADEIDSEHLLPEPFHFYYPKRLRDRAAAVRGEG